MRENYDLRNRRPQNYRVGTEELNGELQSLDKEMDSVGALKRNFLELNLSSKTGSQRRTISLHMSAMPISVLRHVQLAIIKPIMST